MRHSYDQSEYTRPGEEFSLPPEQSATLSGGRRLTDRFGVRERNLAEPDEAERQAAEILAEEGPAGEAPGEELTTSAASSASADAQQTAERRARKKRSLLLQFAAAASSIVLVTNSFGIDLLGLDGLFNDSVIFGEVHSSEPDHWLEPDDEPDDEPEPDLIYGDLIPFGGDRVFPRLDNNDWTVTQDTTVDANNKYIAAVDFINGSMGEQAMVESFVWYGRKAPQFYTGPIPMSIPENIVSAESPSIYYDFDTNTLTLNNYHGKGLMINNMGQDFTIRLEGDSVLSEYLMVACGSVTITGDGGITINDGEHYDYGIHVIGQWTKAHLMLDENVKFDISGAHSIFRVTSTCSEKPVLYKTPHPMAEIYQGQLKAEDTSSVREDPETYHSWLMVGAQTHSTIVKLNNSYRPDSGTDTEPSSEAPSTTVRIPVGGDSSFPMLSNPMPDSVGADGQTHASRILAWWKNSQTGLVESLDIYSNQQNHPTGRDDISYDPATNTLTLNNYSGGWFEIRNMGSSFKIRLVGKNKLDGGISILGDLTSGSVTFTGDGYLSLNRENLSFHGISLDAGAAQACLMIDNSVSMDVYGGAGAISIVNTSAEKGIYYRSDRLPGLVQNRDGGESAPSVPGTFYDWEVLDESGRFVSQIHFGGEEPPETELHTRALPEGAIPVGPDQSYPDTSNYPFNGIIGSSIYLEKITGSNIFYNGDDLNYNNNDSDTIEIYNDGSYSEVRLNNTIPGLRFDPETCTLFLTDFQTDRYLSLLINGTLTIHLEGQNEVEMIIIRPGASYGHTSYCGLVFEGSGSLTLNKDLLMMHGIHMEAMFTPGFIGVGSDVTLTAYSGGSGSPIVILNTESEKAIYRISADEAVPGVVQAGIPNGTFSILRTDMKPG